MHVFPSGPMSQHYVGFLHTGRIVRANQVKFLACASTGSRPTCTALEGHLEGNGWCWWYRKYAPGDTELEKLEKEAREAKKGLWVDPAPIPPWVYRKARRGQSLDLSDLVPLENETEGSTANRGPPLLGAVEPPASSSSPYPIIGNRRSHIYHRPDCPNYSQVAPHNRVAFNSEAEAEAAEYRLAGNCP